MLPVIALLWTACDKTKGIQPNEDYVQFKANGNTLTYTQDEGYTMFATINGGTQDSMQIETIGGIGTPTGISFRFVSQRTIGTCFLAHNTNLPDAMDIELRDLDVNGIKDWHGTNGTFSYIVVGEVGNKVEATFSGTFVAADGSTFDLTEGKLRISRIY